MEGNWTGRDSGRVRFRPRTRGKDSRKEGALPSAGSKRAGCSRIRKTCQGESEDFSDVLSVVIEPRRRMFGMRLLETSCPSYFGL